VGTALNIAYTGAVRDYLGANPTATDPRKYLTESRAAMADLVAHLCEVISPSAG
jgi:fructose-bisphosphate aldolase class II